MLADQSARYAPTEWARTAIALYRQHKADRIVAEVNNGGDMVEATIRMVDPNVSYNKVHASRGKVIRAEPVAALYEQGRIHHVGAFPTLRAQRRDRRRSRWAERHAVRNTTCCELGRPVPRTPSWGNPSKG